MIIVKRIIGQQILFSYKMCWYIPINMRENHLMKRRSLLKICSRRLLAKLCLPKESHPPKVALCINPAPLAKRQLLYWLRPRAKGSIIPENLLQLHPNRTSRYGTTFLALSPLPHQNFSIQSHEWCRPSWGEMLIIPPFRSFGFGIGRK